MLTPSTRRSREASGGSYWRASRNHMCYQVYPTHKKLFRQVLLVLNSCGKLLDLGCVSSPTQMLTLCLPARRYAVSTYPWCHPLLGVLLTRTHARAASRAASCPSLLLCSMNCARTVLGRKGKAWLPS